MKQLAFQYRMDIAYSEPCASNEFTLRCLPATTSAQRPHDDARLTLTPATACVAARDAFGNDYTYGRVDGSHAEFTVAAAGTVDVALADYVDAVTPIQTIVYRQPSPLTPLNDDLRGFAAGLRTVAPLAIMHAVYGAMTYVKGETTVATTAADAWAARRGVCQDYAHVMLAVCRALRLPARYVAGLMVGEGESHAWCEVAVDGRWLAFDPTNDTAVADGHIKFAHGRDADDCPLNRGITLGGGLQTQTVSVRVAPL